ncbi:MAG: lamin tail domain-containing protein [Verrucomicrobiota bacterium]|nr:lamin tail domain-containing protein [Verrucomicrobiota bacterium]
MRLTPTCLLAAAAIAVICPQSPAEQVVFSEIHYNPQGDQPEYLEIYNLTATPQDIANWKFSQGIDYTFPDFNEADPGAVFLQPFERIIIAGVDEQNLREAYVIPAGTKIYGPWTGSLSNAGELLELRDKNGVIRASVEYNDDGRKWPVAADGAGHSLRLIRENRGASNWRNWGPSLARGGTPGSGSVQDEGQVKKILELGSTWKYDQSGVNHGTAWREPGFDDSSWLEGPGFFGKESAGKVMPEPGFQTAWTTGGRITYYLRTEFEWNDTFSEASIQLSGLFDDGVVVYLNGQEVGRNSMPAGVIDWQTRASSHEARIYEPIVEGDVTGVLKVGTNILAVEVHNSSSGSSDIVFGADAFVSSVPVDQSELLKVSEVHVSDDGRVDWVELFVPGEGSVNLDGFAISSEQDFSDAVILEGSIPGGGYASWDVDFPIAENGQFRIYVTAGNNVLDAHLFDRDFDEESFQSDPPGVEWYGGVGHSRNLANTPSRNTNIIINEIMYDAPSDGRNAEYVELYNRGLAPVNLGGWRFVDGISFDFPSSTVIAPGGYLVIAADEEWMLDNYGQIPVLGNFSGQLRDSGELLRLEDEMGNLVDQVDYLPSGDWPELADGDGSSMELRHPQMNNDSPSAWADSDESQKAAIQTFTYTDDFERVRWNPLTGGQELHMHLVGDAHLVIQDISLKLNNSGANLIKNPTLASPDNLSSKGWVCQGTHWASYMGNGGQLHLISDGHGDNKANRAEIDINNLSFDSNYTLTFKGRWVSGKSRLIVQTLDHGFGTSFYLPIPNNLGTPGKVNSRKLTAPAPTITGVVHNPAVPKPGEQIKVTAKVNSALALGSVDVVHRLDSSSGNSQWSRARMYDNGTSGGDVVAGDGIFTATLSSYRTQGNIAQFYVEASTDGGEMSMQPKLGSQRPAMLIVDGREMPDTLLRERFIISLHDRAALGGSGHSSAYAFKFPRMSNHYFNATFIANETEIFYNAEIRKSGSPFTRDGGNSLAHGKWKLPGDRLFRERRRSVFDASGTSEGSGTPRFYDDRIARHFLYLLGHPINEMEFVHWVVNTDAFKLRENHEPISNDFLDRNFADGSEGTLLRIDDEWRFTSDDGNSRQSRNADWSYKNSDNPVRYHSEWLMRTREADYDYSNFIEFVRALGTNNFDEQSINRMADRDMLCINAAVRGYDADWDTLTLNRGKNAYFYRPKGGRWMLIHWDGDRVFGRSSETILGGLSGVRTYFDKPYIRRTLNYYLTELLNRYTRGSARTAAWMEFERQAVQGTGITMTVSHYNGWFNSRESFARNFIGNPFSTAFRITTSGATTSADTINLSGTSPSSVYNVRVAGYPEIECDWTSTTAWTLRGIVLAAGLNEFIVEGVNHEGVVVHSEEFNVTKRGDSPPVAILESSPNSGNVALSEVLSLDASGSYDPEGEQLSYGWSISSDQALLSVEGAQVDIAFASPGNYSVTVEVTDESGNTSRQTKEVLVYSGNDFSSFGDNFIAGSWQERNLEVMDNTPDGASYSLATIPGALHIMLPGDRAYPLGLPQVELPSPVNYLTLGDTWKYSDDNIDYGTEFADPSFDDSAWKSGLGIFGNESKAFPAPGLQTPLDRDTQNQLITYYFRKEFEFDRDPIGSLITIDAILDDGARFWINGQEVGRVRLPAAPTEIGWKTVATSVPNNQEAVLLPAVAVDGSSMLVEGTNLIAVDLHNASASSSDIVMGLNMDIAAHPSGLGGGGLEGTIHPWLRRDLPDEGDWILQTKLELYGLQFGEFMTGLMVEVERNDSRFRYGIGYCNGDELAVVQVTPAATTGKLFSLPYSSASELVVRVRRQGDELIFEWRPGDFFEEVHRISLPDGSVAVTGGPFAATETPQILNVLFDYVALADASSVSPLQGDLVINEVMYKPEGGSQYEFIELFNAGSSVMNLNGFRFPQGEPFDEFVFGEVLIAPGAYVLLVKDIAAFRSRYGNRFDPIIAGQWGGGSLDNGGEVVTLLDADGLVLISFEYDDSDPWPVSPDSDGTSLVLINPSAGNTTNGADWSASQQAGGSPGRNEDPVGGFAEWMENRGEVDPLATRSGDVLNNLLTYALGPDLTEGNVGEVIPFAGIIEIAGNNYLTMTYRQRMDAPGIGYTVDYSPDKKAWEEAGGAIEQVASQPAGDGFNSVTVRLLDPLESQPTGFLRLRVTLP